MAVDRVKPLKLESPESGGIETDDFPTSLDTSEDFIDCRGVSIQDDTSDDDAVLVSRDASGNMTLKDAVVGTKTLTQIQAPGGAHKTTHENGGADEVSVAGLSGELADAQPPKAHKTSHENGGGDEISVAGLSGALADAQTPAAHVTSHHSGGGDALAHDSISGAGTTTHAQIDTHVASTSNPHSVTKAQVGLTNVTDDAQLKRAAADFASFTAKGTPTTNDVLLIEDAADSSNKKKITIGTLPGGGGGDWDGVQVYYVGKHGSDSNDGKCDKLAFLTVAAAIAAVNAQTPGPTNRFAIRIVDAGIYAEGGITIPTCTLIEGHAATIRGDLTFSHQSYAHLYKVIYVYRGGANQALYFAGAAGEEAAAQIDYIDNDQDSGNPMGLTVASGVFELEVGEIRSTHATIQFYRAIYVTNAGVDSIAYVKANQLVGGGGGGIQCTGGGSGAGRAAQCYVEAGYIYGTNKTLHVNTQSAQICAKVGSVAAAATYNAVYFTNSNSGPIILSACLISGAIGSSSATPWLVINEDCGNGSGTAIFSTTSTSPQDVITVSVRLGAGNYLVGGGGYAYNDTSTRGFRFETYDSTTPAVLQVHTIDAVGSANTRFSIGTWHRLVVATATTYTFKVRFNRVGASGTAYLINSWLDIRRIP